MTWLGLIKLKLAEEKSKGNSPSIGDVTPAAKKEWVQIKEGKHPKYTQGKAQTFARKKKNSSSNKKTRKNKGSFSRDSHSSALKQILAECKLCAKCNKKVKKVMSNSPSEAEAEEMSSPVGGKKKKRKMKGGMPTLNPSSVGGDDSGSGCTSCGGQGGGCGCTML